jgi:hypothetical protein
MNSCKDCKHWKNKEIYEAESNYSHPMTTTIPKDFGNCEAIVEQWNAGTYKDLQFIIEDTYKAVVQDGSNYFAILRTRSDFGCKLFENKTS